MARLTLTALTRGNIKQSRYDEAFAILLEALEKASDSQDKRVLKDTLKRARASKKATAENEAATQEPTAAPKATP